MKTQIKLALSAAALTAVLGSSAFAAGLSGNVGVASNYIWRGITQTLDQAAVSGGLDYDFGNGFSLGTWASNVDFGTASEYELDLYGAYGGKIGPADYSIGFTQFRYPVGVSEYFTELNGGLGYGPVSLDVAYTVGSDDNNRSEFAKGDIYVALSGSMEVKPGLSLGLALGRYDFDDATGDDYNHAQISLSKNDFTFALDKTSGATTLNDNDLRVSIAWSHALDL